jgi:radical SAM protein with 4Fe4S-binding SPASM domain
MDLKASYYNHYTVAGDAQRAVLFNQYCGSVAIVPADVAEALKNGALDRLAVDTLTDLESAGFLVSAELDEIDAARQQYIARKASNAALAITMELGQACNLACTYCYQNDYRDNVVITEEAVARLQRYITAVVTSGRRPITDLAFRFIGGEPLMQKDKVLAAVDGLRDLAQRLGVVLHTQMDTNGLLLDESVVRALDALSITLTNQRDHDTVRVRHNGAGSYEQILRRLRRHAEHFNAYQTVLSIRFNANALNARRMPEVYRLVKGLGIHHSEFELYNTVNYDYNLLIPTLTRDQFKSLYMDLIKLKAAHGETITEFPRPTFAPCSAYTPYNLKVTAAGELALCDAMDTPAGRLDDVAEDIERVKQIFPTIAEHNPFDDEQCGTCKNVGICGGKLFCKSNPHVADNNPCDFLPFDLDEFLRFFAETYPTMPERFELATVPQ